MGVKRLVRGVFHVNGLVERDAEGRIRRLVLIKPIVMLVASLERSKPWLIWSTWPLGCVFKPSRLPVMSYGELTDAEWTRLERLLLPQRPAKGSKGGQPAEAHRRIFAW